MASRPSESPGKQRVLSSLQAASYRQAMRLKEKRVQRRQNMGLLLAVIVFLSGVAGLARLLGSPKPNLDLLKNLGIVWGGVAGALLLLAPVLGYMLQKGEEWNEESEN